MFMTHFDFTGLVRTSFYWSLYISANLMKKEKKNLSPLLTNDSKFLTRHQSLQSIPFFCCSTEPSSQPEIDGFPRRLTHKRKVSMKDLRKPTLIPSRSAATFTNDKSNRTLQPEKSQATLKTHIRTQSNNSFLSQLPKKESLKPLKKTSHKINFSYGRETSQSDNFINNYHTTNYIANKVIVHPHQLKIIVANRQKENKVAAGVDRHFDLSHQFQEQEQSSQKWLNQQMFNHGFKPLFEPRSPQNETSQPPNSCHFSFGKNQKTQFMNKFPMREVESRRQSQNQKDSNYRSSTENKLQQPFRLFQDENSRADGRCDHLIRLNLVKQNVSAINSSEEQYSQTSEVIDSLHTISQGMAHSPPSASAKL